MLFIYPKYKKFFFPTILYQAARKASLIAAFPASNIYLTLIPLLTLLNVLGTMTLASSLCFCFSDSLISHNKFLICNLRMLSRGFWIKAFFLEPWEMTKQIRHDSLLPTWPGSSPVQTLPERSLAFLRLHGATTADACLLTEWEAHSGNIYPTGPLIFPMPLKLQHNPGCQWFFSSALVS